MKKIDKFDWAISDTHFGHYNVIIYSKRPFLFEAKGVEIFFNEKLIKSVANEKDAVFEAKKMSVELMNNELILNWNNKVQPNDTIIFGGDFAFLEQGPMKDILSKLNGYKILIDGNHDKSAQAMLDCGFNEVYTEAIVTIEGEDVLFSHYPYLDPEFEAIAKLRPNIIKIGNKDNIISAPVEYDFHESKKFLKDNFRTFINPNAKGGKELHNYMKRAISTHIGSRLINEGKIIVHGHTHSVHKRFANMINISVEAWNYGPASFKELADLVKEIKEEQKLSSINEHNFNSDTYLYYEKIKAFSDIRDIISVYESPIGSKAEYSPTKYSKEWYNLSVQRNRFIAKDKLKDKHFYKGECRNADWAYWDASKNCFTYIRSKWGNEYLEEINTVEDDDGHDLFMPHEEYNISEEEKNLFFSMLKTN